jgi:hypothetical protein
VPEFPLQIGTKSWVRVTPAPVGTTQTQVEISLRSEGLPFQYSEPSRAIISPWIPVGRYRLLWETHFYYRINFDSNARVMNIETERFNEGL